MGNAKYESLNSLLLGEDKESGDYVLEYPDYLSAVYSFGDVLKEKQKFERQLVSCDKQKIDIGIKIDAVVESMKENREERTKLHDDAIEERKKIFEETQKRLDVIIAQETLREKDEANKIIQKRKENLEKQKAELAEREKRLCKDNDALKAELRDLKEEQNALDNYSGDNTPVADEGVLKLLVDAQNKNLFAPYQQKLMSESVDKICEKRVHSINDLIIKEKEFAQSDMVKAIRKGKVTSKVIAEFSNVIAVVCSVAMLLCALLTLILPLDSTLCLCLSLVDLGLSGVLCGGVLMAIVEQLGKRFWFDDELSKEERSLLIFCFVAGVIGGFFIWKNVLFGKVYSWFVLYYLLASGAAALTVRRFLRLDVCTKQLSKLEFLKNRARKHIFNDAVGKKNGRYDLLIYCYINHDAVVEYLSIKFKKKKTLANTSRIELNQNIVKHNLNEVAKLIPEWDRIKKLEEDMLKENERTNEELAQKIEKIESRRGNTDNVDFEDEISQNVLDKLAELDEEFAKLSKNKLALESECNKIEDEYESAKENLTKASSDYEAVKKTIVAWTDSPLPTETDFRLCDTFCLEVGEQIGLIHHNLKPTMISYNLTKEHENPISPIIGIISSCIKGLMKINPKNMIQFSIIDPVSDPDILLSDKNLNKTSENGIIHGTYSLRGCEIRLLDSRESFSVFMNSLARRITDLKRFLNEKADCIPHDTPKNYDLANRLLRSDTSPFTYQIMIFVVPRSADVTDFMPPHSVTEIMRAKMDIYKTGIFPIFFVNNGNIHKDWKDILSLIDKHNIYRIGSKK